MTEILHALDVHVKSMPASPGPCQNLSTYSTVIVDASASTVPVFKLLMGRSLYRIGLVVSIIGQSSDVAYLCGSAADANKLAGAQFMGLQVTPVLPGTEEVWVALPAGGGPVQFGVIATFAEVPR